jgi:hypothetical protein
MTKTRMDRKSDGSIYKKTDKEQKRQLHNAICCWILNSLSALPLPPLDPKFPISATATTFGS